MKTYIFNTNFHSQTEDSNLIIKQRQIMEQIDEPIVVISEQAPFNYNRKLKLKNPHIRSLCYGLLIIDDNDNVLVDKHFPKTSAMFIATMFRSKEILLIANNGINFSGKHFNIKVENVEEKYYKDQYLLEKVYLIYIKGDVTSSVILEEYYCYYDKTNNWTVVSYGQINILNILHYIKGQRVLYTDNKQHTKLLNAVDSAYAIGDNFDLQKLAEHVNHVDKYFLINEYIKLFL